MRAPTLAFGLLLATPALTVPGVAGCDSPGGGLQSGDVTSYGVDAGGTGTPNDENLFSRLFGASGKETQPACVGDDCPPPPAPTPEPVCTKPLPPSVSVSTQCQTLCQKLVACTGSSAMAQNPCVTECNKSLTAVAPDVISAAMGCYMAASCDDIEAAMGDEGTTSTEPAPAPAYPADTDAGGAYPGDDASGAPQDPMPEPGPVEDTALQRCLDASMRGIMENPLAGADQAFCDGVTAKSAACQGQPVDPTEPTPGASGDGLDGDAWFCQLMAHLLNDTARDMLAACYALPCDQVEPCIQDLQPCFHLPLSDPSDSVSGAGSGSTGTDDARPVPAP